MTEHTCREFDPYCYRCELNLSELSMDALKEMHAASDQTTERGDDTSMAIENEILRRILYKAEPT